MVNSPAGVPLLSSDLKMRYELLGLQGLLVPFPQYVSAQRLMMFASNITQALVLHGCEAPHICTGYEGIIGRYEFDDTRRDQDIIILAVIPKFRMDYWSDSTPTNPTLTVIYLGQEDHKIGYFDVSTYTKLHDGFGYMNTMLNSYQLVNNNLIPKEMKFVTSPNHDGNFYKQGVNGNVVFLSDWAVTEDAFKISDEIAEKSSHTAIHTLKLNIHEDSVPLNLYGTTEDYKAIPDIGSIVRDDNIIIALRGRNKTTFVTDMTDEALQIIEDLHDEKHYAEGEDAQILDVNVYINFDAYKRLKNRQGPYAQFVKYKEQHDAYYAAVLAVYDRVQADGYELRPEFNTLVTRCIGLLAPKNRVRQRLQLVDKKEPVEFISVEITYAYTRKVGVGYKFTGRDGAKGVVSEVCPKKYMPRDAFGNIADFCITTASVINRMNPGQFLEQFINALSTAVVKRVKLMTDWREAYAYIMEYVGDIRPVLRQKYESLTPSDENKQNFVEDCKEKGIYLIFGFIENITYEKIIYLADKYGVVESPLTYTVLDENGNPQVITTKSKTLVGEKHFLLLGKIPDSMLHAVEISYGNQFGTPTKPTSKHIKSQSPVGTTCQRFGEDEICMETMSMHADTVARQMSIYGNSPDAVRRLIQEELTNPHPTQIAHIPMTTNDMIRKNRNIELFSQLMGVCGYDVRPLSVIEGGE